VIGFFDRIKQALHPFAAIAEELRIIRELYEEELSERVIVVGDRIVPAPVRRITEKPSKHDTEVSYPGDEMKPRRVNIFEPWDEGDEDDSLI